MSYIKNKLSKKDTAKNTAARIQQEQKDAARAERRALKDSKKEDKRLQKIDNMLSDIFNTLSQDLDISVLALEKSDGALTQWVGGANSLTGVVKNGFGLAAKNIGSLTIAQIESNTAYQNYKQIMDNEGYEVEVTNAWGAEDLTVNKCGTTVSTSIAATCLMSGFPPIQILGGAAFGATALYNIAATNWNTAHFTLQLTEKKPVALLEYMPVQNDIANLLSQLDEQKAPQKVKARQPIIK